VLCSTFRVAEMFCILQPHCSGLQKYKFGGSTRTGRVGLRSAVKQRKSAFLEQSHKSPCYLHRSNICRQAVIAWQIASHFTAVDRHQHVSGLCAVFVSVTMFQSSCIATVHCSDSFTCSYAMFQDTALPFTVFRPVMAKLRSPCRCQASDSNGKPGMLFGLKNPFRGLKFGNQASDEETTQAEQESQQQLAAEKAQPIGNGMPWRAWKQVLHLCSSCHHAHLLCLPYRQPKLEPCSESHQHH